MDDSRSLLTFAAILLRRMDELTYRVCHNQHEVEKMREETAELEEKWRLSELERHQKGSPATVASSE
jgi:uncharacterized membrane protein